MGPSRKWTFSAFVVAELVCTGAFVAAILVWML